MNLGDCHINNMSKKKSKMTKAKEVFFDIVTEYRRYYKQFASRNSYDPTYHVNRQPRKKNPVLMLEAIHN